MSRGDGPRVPSVLVACGLALVLVAVLLPALGGYGPTVDLGLREIGYGHRFLSFALTGEEAFLAQGAAGRVPPARTPHPDFTAGIYVIAKAHAMPASVLSAALCELLWTRLAWLPAMSAHNLAALLFFAALATWLAVFGAGRFGWTAGAGAALAWLLSPRLLAHGLHNIKDVPETALYVWTYAAIAAALTRAGTRRWMLVGVLFGVALAQKANALFLPLQALLYFVAIASWRRRQGRPGPRLPWRGVGLVLVVFPLAFLAVSPYYWSHTVERLVEHFGWVAGWGQVPSGDRWLGVLHVLWTTPLPVLALALIGLCSRLLSGEQRIFLLVGLCVPMGRTLLPNLRNFDGMRHFMEYAPMLCLLAGVGLADLVGRVRLGLARAPALKHLTLGVLFAGFVVPGGRATWKAFPHGICYYNELVGGLAGAQARNVEGAFDYWANSMWAGLGWVSAHAEPGATLAVPVIWQVAEAARPARLRDDITLLGPGEPLAGAPLYVLSLVRPRGRDYELVRRLAARHEPVHEIRVQDAPILQVFRIEDTAEIARVARLCLAQRLALPLLDWMEMHRPDLLAGPDGILGRIRRDGLQSVADELRRALGRHELQAHLDELLVLLEGWL